MSIRGIPPHDTHQAGSAGAKHRPTDAIRVEAVGGGAFDAFTSLQITNDIMAPAEAAFELGDDGSWPELENYIDLGAKFRVYLNDRLRLTGRVEQSGIPTDAQSGATVQFTVKTKLADAAFASAHPNTRVQNTSIKTFLLALYAPLGYLEKDFVFRADVSRDLLTGRSSKSKPPVDLEAIKLEEAKVNPPETIFACADRHLARHHLMHWDCPDGRIVVGAPDDSQVPVYPLQLRFPPMHLENNLLQAMRARDIGDVPTVIGVFGTKQRKAFALAKVRGVATSHDLVDANFYRPVLVLDESVPTKAAALARANRELAARSRKKDAWELNTDGWSYWDGRNAIPYGIDTVADMHVDTAGNAIGPYYVERVVCRRAPDTGDTTQLRVVQKGVWVL